MTSIAPIDVETRKLAMTMPRLVAVIVAAVTASHFATSYVFATATKDDIKSAIAEHGQYPHNGATDRLGKLEGADAEQNAKLAKLEDAPQELRALRARIDLVLITQMQIPQRARHMRKAASVLRNAAESRGEDDPLAGLEGL